MSPEQDTPGCCMATCSWSSLATGGPTTITEGAVRRLPRLAKHCDQFAMAWRFTLRTRKPRSCPRNVGAQRRPAMRSNGVHLMAIVEVAGGRIAVSELWRKLHGQNHVDEEAAVGMVRKIKFTAVTADYGSRCA